jgi:hypothetical protein
MGGTAVGRAAANARISWSICHYMAGMLANCPVRSHWHAAFLKNASSNNHPLDAEFCILPPPQNVPVWHLPPRFFLPSLLCRALGTLQSPTTMPGSSQAGDSAAANDTPPPSLFVIVRNPYSRALSKYFFQQEKDSQVSSEMVNDAPRMNAWLCQRLSKMIINQTGWLLNHYEKFHEWPRSCILVCLFSRRWSLYSTIRLRL